MTALLTCTAAALSSGCAAQPYAASPELLPSRYEHDGALAAEPPTAGDWWREFGSERLDELVKAASDNLDLAAAEARVKQADARARQAGAAILPNLDGTGNANFLSGHSSRGGGHELDWSALLSASYELDFWGGNRAALRSAQLLSGAARAERDTVALTLLAGVANEYFQILALRERVDIARSNSDAARQLLEVVEARFDAGAAGAIEVATQRAAYDTARISMAELQQNEIEARASLSLLLGRPPENFELPAQHLEDLTEPAVSAGLPSDLLTRRPDIIGAEANLRSAHANLTVARAAMFPSISLTASAGLQNPALPATVLTIPGVGPSVALGAGLVQPIFDHGRLRAQRDEVQARYEELLSNYRTAIITSLTDVENSLAAIHHLDGSRAFHEENLAQSARAFEGAKLRYQAGSGDFLTLLEAQRTLYNVRDEAVLYKLARLQSLVGLFKALGGGWSVPAAGAGPTPALSKLGQ